MTEYIKKAYVEQCMNDSFRNSGIPAEARKKFQKWLDKAPAADGVEIKKEGEWDMFDLISSAYYGKGMYFMQDNGTVYSRHSGEYMTVDEAIREFISLIDEDVICVPSVTTTWADGEAPTYALRKKGKWMHKEITADFHAIGQCSVCKERRRLDNFCSNCGADMKED